MNLAALAQFDLAPPVSSFPHDLEEEDEKAAAQLLVKADRPLRYFFLHSSAAELIFRALAWNSGHDDYPELAAGHLIEFFKNSQESAKQLAVVLSNVIRNPLKLTSNENEENRLRSRLLADDGIYAFVEKIVDRLPLDLMAICLIILKKTETETFGRYRDLVQRKIDDGTVLGMAITRPFWENRLFLQLVKGEYPLLLASLRNQLANVGLCSLIKTTEFQNFLMLIANLAEPDDSWWSTALDSIPDSELDEMIQRTVASGRSIGIIDLALRELKTTNPALLEKLERKIGAKRYLHLIADAGTISDLFKAIEHSSLSMAEELIEALDTETLDTLIAKTIASCRSIGTIHLALWELKETDPALLEKLERKIGPKHYLHLITSIGTVTELLKVIGNSSLSMAGKLLETLDAETLDALIAKTIASGRSIGTITFALRELKKTNPALLEKLEHKIGAKRHLHLIASAGTIFELFMTIKHSSPSMAGELIDALNAETLDTLIAKTIASGRSIGTIHLALRELKKMSPALLEKLERKIGVQHYLHLIASAGSILELFRIIHYSSLSMAGELIETLNAETLDTLIAKTIASGRSIGTINLALRKLKETDEALLRGLERKIGAQRYLHLIASNGTIFELFSIIQHSSLSMVGELIDALNTEILDALIAKTITSGRSIGTIDWTLRELKETNPAVLVKLERKIGAKRWWQLICTNGTMSVLMQILHRMDRAYRKEFVQGSKHIFLAQWQELLLRGGFYDLALFVGWSSLFFSKQFTKVFLSSLKPTFETLIRCGGWEALDRGATLLQESPDSPIKKYLSDLLQDYLATVDLGSLHFNSFGDAMHCVHLLWQELPSYRKELTDSLLSILPEEKVWYTDEQFLRSACLLFIILANPQAWADDARRVLVIGNGEEVAALCAEATTLDLFLYHWNLYSLWFQWESEGDKTFATFLHSEIRDTTSNALAKRLRTHAGKEVTDNQIALAGLLSFLGLAVSPVEKAGWLSSLPSFDELVKRVQSKTFIPGFFFLLGLEWIFDRTGGVPQQTWRHLLSKAEAYTEKTAALEYLRDFVRVRAGSKV